MKDALGQQINVGDYLAYSHRDGMAIVRVEGIEEYDTYRGKSGHFIGKYAVARAINRNKPQQESWWRLRHNGQPPRPIHSPERAIKIDASALPQKLISLLNGEIVGVRFSFGAS